MEFSESAELDYTVPGREFNRISVDVSRELNKRLENSSFAEVDLKLIYCPILMSDRYIESYPARSRYQRKKKILGCAPQLDYARYMAGNFKTRRDIYLDGLLNEAEILMKRANIPSIKIAEFQNIIEAIKSDIAEQEQSDAAN